MVNPSPVRTQAQADVLWAGLMGLQSQPGPVYRVREILSSSVAHEDVKCNVLMPRNDHIWEALINLCLPPWLVLPLCLESPPLL